MEKMLIKCILNALAAWMIFEPQAIIKVPHSHCGSPLPLSEAGKIASGNGDTSFSALLSGSTSPQRLSLHLPTLSFLTFLFSSRKSSVIFTCAQPLWAQETSSNFESSKKLEAASP